MVKQETDGPPQHRTLKGAQRIEALTAVAADMFLERGFKAVAVDDLIAQVGGSRRNVYSHFGGKEGLFVAAMTQVCEEISSQMENVDVEAPDVRSALLSFGCQFLELMLEPRALALYRIMVTDGKSFPEISQAMYNAGARKVIDTLAKWIKIQTAGPQSEFVTASPAVVLADQFIFLVLGNIHLRALVGIEQLPLSKGRIKRVVRNAVNTFLDGVEVHEPV